MKTLQTSQDPNPQSWSALELALRYLLAEEEKHRLANNLQIIIGNFERQAASTASAEVRHALSCACDQIAGLGRLHSMLRRPERSDDTTSCWRYVNHLGLLVELIIMAPRGHRLEMTSTPEAEILIAEQGQMHMLGLIAYELITNAAKHAFPRDTAGLISVHLSGSDGQLILTISDNGLGWVMLPASTQSGGMHYIGQLSDEAGGTCSWVFSSRGTKAKIQLPLQRPPSTASEAAQAIGEKLLSTSCRGASTTATRPIRPAASGWLTRSLTRQQR